MKVTLEGIIFEGTPNEIYEVLSRLGYLSKLIQPFETIKKEDLPSTPPAWPHIPVVPYWTQPYTIGDPPPGTYPIVWSGSGSTMTSFNDAIIGKIPSSDDLDKLDS